MSEAIKIKIGTRQQQNINVSDRPNPHYITNEVFQEYQNYVSEKYITKDTLNQTINSLGIPHKLTDLEIDLALVKYDPNKDYLEVVE